MLGIILERTLDVGEELSSCFIESYLDLLNVDPKSNWYRLVLKEIDQRTVCGSGC